MEKGKIVGPDGAPAGGGIVTPSGLVFKNVREQKPKAVGEFIVCEIIRLDTETEGGLAVVDAQGNAFLMKIMVDNIGDGVNLKGLKKGDNLMLIAPEEQKFAWSTKTWCIVHEDQVKSVIVDAEEAADAKENI